MMKLRILTEQEWRTTKREPLQRYKDYANVVEDNLQGIPIATGTLARPSLPKADAMRAAESRATDSNQLVLYSYSAGLPTKELALLMESGAAFWESYAQHHLAFHQSPECDGHLVPHLDLYDRDYWEALQLVCFAILLGHPQLLGRIMELLVYQNDDQDALLEALVAPYLPGRPGSAVYTRQLPYRKTKKIFEATPDKRPALMAKYLDEWYETSRREPYYDRHKASYFPGYWSLEAAAITFVLDIDDSSYRDKPFYPKDLVDHARSVSVSPLAAPPQAGGQPGAALRCVAGEPCPRAGWWFTPARAGSRRRFAQGEVTPDVGGDYGATIWQWDATQDR